MKATSPAPLAIQGQGPYAGIQAFAESITPPPLTELEAGIPAYQRRLTDADRHFINSTNFNDAGIDLIDQHLAPEPSRLSVAGHHEWRESLAAPARAFDELDELVAAIRESQTEGDDQ